MIDDLRALLETVQSGRIPGFIAAAKMTIRFKKTIANTRGPGVSLRSGAICGRRVIERAQATAANRHTPLTQGGGNVGTDKEYTRGEGRQAKTSCAGMFHG
jgi:hypothetical protein